MLGLVFFCAFWLLLGVLYIWGLLVVLASLVMYKTCFFFGVPLTGRVLWALFGWGITLSNPLGECYATHKLACVFLIFLQGFCEGLCIVGHVCWPQ